MSGGIRRGDARTWVHGCKGGGSGVSGSAGPHPVSQSIAPESGWIVSNAHKRHRLHVLAIARRMHARYEGIRCLT
jgi:hypothetical protein